MRSFCSVGESHFLASLEFFDSCIAKAIYMIEKTSKMSSDANV